MKGIKDHCQSSKKEISNRDFYVELISHSPLNYKDMLWQCYLYLNRQTLTRLICIHEIYKKVMETHGVIMQFGVFYGRDLALMINLRGMYEPFNYTRKIIGFDTFGGLPELHEKDGDKCAIGDFSVPEDYIDYLFHLLQYHRNECPNSHIRDFELIKGDVKDTFPKYLKKNPETVISLAYLDMDLYLPTKSVLDIIEPYLVKGSIVVFDELNFKQFPGETHAFRESGFNKYRLHTFSTDPTISYVRYGY